MRRERISRNIHHFSGGTYRSSSKLISNRYDQHAALSYVFQDQYVDSFRYSMSLLHPLSNVAHKAEIKARAYDKKNSTQFVSSIVRSFNRP